MRNLTDLGGKITEYGKAARDLLAAGLTNQQIIDELVKRYADREWNMPSLRQYVSNLRYTQKRKAGIVRRGRPSSLEGMSMQGSASGPARHSLPSPTSGSQL